MKNLKKTIHIYITTVSMLAFLTGWSFLAHAPNSITAAATSSSAQTITSASPLPSISSLLNLTQSTSTSRSSANPVLRTSGS